MARLGGHTVEKCWVENIIVVSHLGKFDLYRPPMSSSGSSGSSWEQQASLERTFELGLGGDKGVTLARG